MADRQIFQLTAKTAPLADDVIGIQVTGGASEQGKISITDLFGNIPVNTTLKKDGYIGLTLETDDGSSANIGFTKSGKIRWQMSCEATATSGGNEGSDFRIVRVNDAGTPLDTPFTIVRKTGFVGIGPTAPTAKLHVAANSAVVAIDIESADAKGTLNSRSSTQANLPSSLMLASIGTAKIHINAGNGLNPQITTLSTGNVGIGTVTPTQALHVKGRFLFVENGTDFSAIRTQRGDGQLTMSISTANASTGNKIQSNIYYRDDSSGNVLGTYAINEDGNHYWLTGDNTIGNRKMTLLANGNVGIGTDSPAHKLEVAGAVKIGRYMEIGDDANYHGTLISRTGDEGVFLRGSDSTGASTTIADLVINSKNKDLIYRVGSPTSATELFRVKGNGWVGIGKVPVVPFDFAGSRFDLNWSVSSHGLSFYSLNTRNADIGIIDVLNIKVPRLGATAVVIAAISGAPNLNIGRVGGSRTSLAMAGLPTSATGLISGDVYRSGSDLKIVP